MNPTRAHCLAVGFALCSVCGPLACHDGAKVAAQLSAWCQPKGIGGFESAELVSADLPAAPAPGHEGEHALAPLRVIVGERVMVEWRAVTAGTNPEIGALVAALGEELDRRGQWRGQASQPGATTVTLGIAPQTPSATVLTVLSALGSVGIQRVLLMAWSTTPAPVPPAPDPELAASFKVGDASESAVQAAVLIDESITWCPGLSRAFEAVAMAAPDLKCQLMARGIEEGLAPWCIVDERAMMTGFWTIFANQRAPAAKLVLLDPQAPPIDLGTATSWAQMAPAVFKLEKIRP